MKNLILIATLFLIYSCSNNPKNSNLEVNEIQIFGDSTINEKGKISATELINILSKRDSAIVRVEAPIISVCQKKGCWMYLELDSTIEMLVRFKDYSFFVPMECARSNFKLDQATNDNQIMIHEALKGLKSIYKEGYIYKKAGVIVGNLIPNNQIQLNLFDNLNNRNKYKKISTIFDKINNSMGKDKIRIAVQGFDRKWQMKQEQLSPAYTTRIEEILTIKI